MYFQQITTPGLGCFSYVIGCPKAGVMAVVDPRRDISVYLDVSRNAGMRVTHIFETHVHADHVSGAPDLRRATGADIYIHESAPVEYEAKKLAHDEVFTLGPARIRVLHTPGHTPNSVSLLVADLDRSPEPAMILTGDLLFVGDTGRPDLPGAEILDEQVWNLYNSLNVLLADLPDGLEVYPAHGQGSLCGGGLSAKPQSTLGYERVANPRLRWKTFEDFKRDILSNLPMRPQSFSHIIATNLKGAPPTLPRDDNALSPEAAAELLRQGAAPLDLRASAAFCAAHIPGSIHVDAVSPQVVNWIGTVLSPDQPFFLVLENDADFDGMLTQLRRIGYDDVRGYLRGGIVSWIGQGRDIQSLPMVSPGDLTKRLGQSAPPLVIDVRGPGEYAKSRVEPSLNLPFDALLSDDECPGEPGREKLVICQTGYRSAIAASLLQARGCANVSTLAGGLAAAFAPK